jgi:peptidylprolyl isomerase
MPPPLCANPGQINKEIILEKVENGNYISVDYKGTLTNGEVFDSSEGRQPIEVHMGAGEMIQGFEAQLLGMSLNEKKVFTLTPEEAYGQKNPEMMKIVPRSEIPPDMDLQLGMMVGMITPQGEQIPARVVQLDDANLTMDLNHPLAGESLTFEIEVVGISSTPTQEPSNCEGDCDCGCSCGCDD